ncbi:MAG: 30S ribosomal protein S6 [Verrucomicrobia bacterium]|nr:30S ribosomal protein S6 [Verrucomicrobiota bacterium]
MNKYEGMFILPERIKEEALDDVLGRVKAEIEKLGGVVASMTRLGKRTFARAMQKQDGGQFVVINFSVEGDRISDLHKRMLLDDDVFRVQIVRAEEGIAAGASAGGGDNGISE